MFGEDHQKQYETSQSIDQQQSQIDAPIDFFSTVFSHADEHHHQRQYRDDNPRCEDIEERATLRWSLSLKYRPSTVNKICRRLVLAKNLRRSKGSA